jgi:alpha-glucosidase
VELLFSISGGELSYHVQFEGRPVLKEAPLAIRAAGDAPDHEERIGTSENYSIHDSYPWYGVHSLAQESGTGMRFPILRADGTVAYTVDARAYDNGVAFRMILPGEKARVPLERTGFEPIGGSSIWSFDPTRSQYEGVYTREQVKDLRDGQLAAPPVTIELPHDAAYLAITEGDLKDYPGMALQADGSGALVVRLGNTVPPDKALVYFQGQATAQRLAQPVAISGTIRTPWRIVMIASNLDDLVNNDIVSDVSSPPNSTLFPEGIHTSWIKPGRAVWDYLDGGAPTLSNAEEFSKMAGELGFQYQVVEGWWRQWTEDQLKELTSESQKYGVGIWLWRNRKDLATPESREAFFDLSNRVGVIGVKIDFFDSEAQEVVDLYPSILKEAAEHHLLVNFHGSNKPTGEQRTWPNELTREAVEGMEYCCIDGVPDAPRAIHTVTLPFTRLLAGPADYTPVLFDKGLNGTTWTNQIASAVVMTSPLLTYAANPRTMLTNPAVDVIRDIPATWDETIVLPPSRIGDLAVYARRSGSVWFLAVMNGDKRQSVTIPLNFLPSGSWSARIVGDVPEQPAADVVKQATFQAADVIHLALRPGGGYLAEFRQK